MKVLSEGVTRNGDAISVSFFYSAFSGLSPCRRASALLLSEYQSHCQRRPCHVDAFTMAAYGILKIRRVSREIRQVFHQYMPRQHVFTVNFGVHITVLLSLRWVGAVHGARSLVLRVLPFITPGPCMYCFFSSQIPTHHSKQTR